MKRLILIFLTWSLLSICTFQAWGDEDLVMSLMEASEQSIKEGNWPEAENALVNALNASSGQASDALLWSNLGIIRMNQGKDSTALLAFNNALNLTPNAVTILVNRARLLASMHKLTEAEADCSKAMELDTALIEPFYLRALIRVTRGDVSGATADCQRLELLQPTASETHQAWAYVMKETGQFERAIPHYTRLLEREPLVEYFTDRGICRLMLDRFSEASEDIDEALRMNPTDPQLYRLRAMLYQRQYRPEDAQKDLMKAQEIEKGNCN